MKKYLCLYSVILICSIFLATVSTASEEDNPIYLDWSQFKPGSFVIYKYSTETAGITSEMEETYTLKEITPEKIILEVKTVIEAAGIKVEGETETVEYPAKGEGERMIVVSEDLSINVSDGDESTQVDEEGTEKIKIKDTEIEAQRVKVQTEDDTGTEITATVWYSDEIPGGMVKSLTEVENIVPIKAEMVVIDYKAIKE